MKNHLVALVTGGASGIGLATVERFISEGYKVAVFDANKSAKEVIKNSLKSEVNDVFIYEVDVTNLTPSVLLNSAGISPPLNPLHKYEIDDWNRCVSINLNGTFMVTREFINSYIENKLSKGSIINISSIMGSRASAAQAVYSATKHGVVGLAKSVAQDYAHLNLRANAIGPGVIETPMTNDVLVDENVKNHLLTRIPLKRVAQASEVASLVYFLATDESSYITGTYIPIDGGYLSS
jgi:NAD(P)-dependent dehydrogenase (short-subunit alcohol dehydrogenase family)